MNTERIIEIARSVGINCDPAGPGDDGFDTWYGNQYLPSGALIAFANAIEVETMAKAQQAM